MIPTRLCWLSLIFACGCQGARTSTEEVCDGLDNDGDGLVDEQLLQVWYHDVDFDKVGDEAAKVAACDRPWSYVATAGDCDDHDPTATTWALWWEDSDGDGYAGAGGAVVSACTNPSTDDAPYATATGDCEPNDAESFPGAEEICQDDVDNDCDGTDSTCPFDTTGVSYADCPAWAPYDVPDVTWHWTGDVSSYDYFTFTVETKGRDETEGLQVWLLQTSGYGYSDGGTYYHYFNSILAVTCEVDGVHLVSEERTDTVVAHEAASSDSTNVYWDRPLFIPAEMAPGDTWTVDYVSFPSNPSGEISATRAKSAQFTVSDDRRYELDGTEYDSMVVTAEGDYDSEWHFARGIGLVKIKGTSKLLLSSLEGL